MNTRSLRFQLIVWYAGLLTGCFVLLGAGAYFVIQGYLVNSLKQSQLRRARLISQLVVAESRNGRMSDVGTEVENRYSPSSNDRFVRVSGTNGEVYYCSSAPAGLGFNPGDFPPPAWPPKAEGSIHLPLANGRQMLIATHVVPLAGGNSYLVEAGAPMDEVWNDLRHWVLFLVAGLPAVMLISIGGGYVLIRRALMPVDRIAASAEHITSHNLGDRLPIARTGDELERLSVALNLMIGRLEEAFHHSRRFMADASHELRTPLTVLRGELESLVQEKNATPELCERLGSALEEVERLVNIVEGLFAISRLDAGEAQAEWVKFDLAHLATATADQMSLLGEDKQIKLSCATSKDVWVEGDRARMKQVVVNLLDNAIKYTAPGGAVGLTVSAREGKALLEVSDNGMGIPPESLPRVFERFFRVDAARSRELGGAGLGLSIVKSICTAHHGQVEALSTPGHGSIFRVELPLASHSTNGKNGGKHE